MVFLMARFNYCEQNQTQQCVSPPLSTLRLLHPPCGPRPAHIIVYSISFNMYGGRFEKKGSAESLNVN